MVTVDVHVIRMDAWSWAFRLGLDELEAAYKAARNSSDARKGRLNDQWIAFQADVAAGKASLYDTDEDGQIVHDYGEQMGEMLYDVDTALKLVREAFTISLAHYWERDMNRRLKTDRYKDEDVFSHLKDYGLSPDEASLTALRLASNVAKHSGGNSAVKLYALRPDLFETEDKQRVPGSPTYENLLITDAVVESFFEAARASGPQGRT